MITKTSNPSAINGTSFHKGTIDTSLAQLENALGIEAERVLDEKVNYEFDLELADGTPFTIYDWKEGFLAPPERCFSISVRTAQKIPRRFVRFSLMSMGLKPEWV